MRAIRAAPGVLACRGVAAQSLDEVETEGLSGF